MIYPISFIDNTCVHCGEQRSVKFVDIYRNNVKDPIYPATKMVCMKCNTEYFIRWISKENSDEMIPVTCSDNIKQIFEEEIIKYSKEHRRKL